MGLFIFLIIMLAAAWGFIFQLNEMPPPPPHVPVAQHAPPAAQQPAPAVAPTITISDQAVTDQKPPDEPAATPAEPSKEAAPANSNGQAPSSY